MTKIIMALDQGTSSSRTILFNQSGRIVAEANQPLASIFPDSGWVEQDPEEIWRTQQISMRLALEQAGLTMADVTAVGITNQRETFIAWDRRTGQAVANAIVWQCRRTADFCAELKKEGFEDEIRGRTGLVADPYFSGTKMSWLLKNNPTAGALAASGDLALGTVDSWLIWKLSAGKAFVTDASNASRTLLYNIVAGDWDQVMLDRLEISREALPRVLDSSGVFGHTDADQWGAAVPIAGVAGDQQAALFGQGCFDLGAVKNTYGTGCFMLANTGKTPSFSKSGLLTTVAWQLNGARYYALEGSVFMAGALMQWLRDDMDLFADVALTQAMAEAVDDNGGVFIVPAFTGLGAPYWDPYARGLMIGLSRGTNKNHIVRAGLEAIAFQCYDLVHSMESDLGGPLGDMKVDGGATRNDFLCQFQADLFRRDVIRPKVVETTAMGAAFLAGLATGVWRDQDQIKALWREDRRFRAQMEQSRANALQKGWREAVARCRGWLQ